MSAPPVFLSVELFLYLYFGYLSCNWGINTQFYFLYRYNYQQKSTVLGYLILNHETSLLLWLLSLSKLSSLVIYLIGQLALFQAMTLAKSKSISFNLSLRYFLIFILGIILLRYVFFITTMWFVKPIINICEKRINQKVSNFSRFLKSMVFSCILILGRWLQSFINSLV